MNKTLSRTYLAFLLLFSIVTLSLPQFGYAQVTSQHASVSAYSKKLQSIEEKTEARRKELGIPGMSLVIVKDDQIIYVKGLGYKDYENKIAVTPDTQFAIGSATKAFTALSVLMSQDDGKLSLDDSPRKALPYFKMFDADTDKNILIRDLMCHSSGLASTDLGWYSGGLDRMEVIRLAGEAKPTAKLREKFQYQNVMFAAAGEIVAAVQKQPYEKLVAERIFKPLGMTNSSLSVTKMQNSKDYSFGYRYNFDTKVTERLPFKNLDVIAPAGSINSSARDMAEWVRFVLNHGAVGGKRLVSERGFDEWLKPQITVAGKTSYGLGWFLQDWNGLKVVQHGGNIDGFNSMVAMIPEKKIGFVVLSNVTGSSIGNELMQTVWSNLIDMPKSPEAAKLPVKTMQFMAGKYRLEPAKMDFEVKIVGEDLVMVVPGQPEYKLEPTGPRQFKMLGTPDGFAVKFSPEQGDTTSLYLQQPQGNYTLPRVNADGTLAKVEPQSPPAGTSGAGSGPTYLVGRYTPPGSSNPVIEIKEDTGKVTFNIPGQQPYALVEKSKDVYSLTPLPDAYWLTTKRDGAGKVVSVVVTQPEGKFEFKRLETATSTITITAEELMQKVIDASGGEAAWRKLTTRVSTFDTVMENQGVRASGTSYAKSPDKAATDTTMTALGKTIARGWEYFDGTGGGEEYTFSPADKYTGKRLDDVRLGAHFYGLLDRKTLFRKIEILRTETVGDDECYVVEFTPYAGSYFTEYYSTKTFLLRKREGTIPSSTSEQKIPYTITFDDYHDVYGIKVAFKNTSYNIGNGNTVTILKDVKYNVPVDDKLFAPRKVK